MKPFFITIPHSGEKIAPDAEWLQGLPEPIQMCDVDRYVDQLYAPVIIQEKIPAIVTDWHRYVVDLNREPEDIDSDAVLGAGNASGKFVSGFHWVVTTKGDRLMDQPISRDKHQEFVKKYYQPFHQEVERKFKEFKAQGFKNVFQLDVHSMPSVGEKLHRDPGQRRADIVISDFNGVSCGKGYSELVIKAYENSGFKVAVNWPYIGGRITQKYGKPEIGQQTIQVELNRALYMDETTKKIKPADAAEISQRLSQAVKQIVHNLPA